MAVSENRGIRGVAIAVPDAATSIGALLDTAVIATRGTYREVSIQLSIYQSNGATANAANVWLGDETLGTTVNSVKQRSVELTPGASKTFRSNGASDVYLRGIFVMRDPNTAGSPVILIDAQAL